MFEALRYKLEGRGFDCRWCHWNFSLTQSFRPHYDSGVDSASNRNEYQEYFLAWNSQGLSRPVMGLLCLLFYFIRIVHLCNNLKRGDNHPTKNSNPSCTAVIHTLPPLTVCLSAPTSHGPTSYWLPLPTSPSNPPTQQVFIPCTSCH